jgi:hypothetical protein
MTSSSVRVRGTLQLEADAPVNQSVERAMRLLGFFSAEEPELTLAQLTTRLGASKPTTHRYTLALRRTGLLRFDATRGVYSLGVRLVELAAAARYRPRIPETAHPTSSASSQPPAKAPCCRSGTVTPRSSSSAPTAPTDSCASRSHTARALR